jgi:hypothetical protein
MNLKNTDINKNNMAKKKTASTGNESLVPFGYILGTDVIEFLTAFGFDADGKKTIEDFVSETFNITL